MESNFLIHKKKKKKKKTLKERKGKEKEESNRKTNQAEKLSFSHLFGESQDKRSIFKVRLYEVTESKKYPSPLTDPLIPIMHQSIIKIDSKLT